MSYVYHVAEKAVTLEPQKQTCAVRYREPAAHSTRASIARSCGARFEQRIEVPNEKYTLHQLLPTATDGDAVAAFQAACDKPSAIVRVAPVFTVGSTRVFASDKVLIGLKDINRPVEHVLTGISTLAIRSRGNGEYTLQLPVDQDPLAIAQQLATHAGLRYAEPNFINSSSRLAGSTEPGDPLAPPQTLMDRQYALKVIKADALWPAIVGIPSIRIAIIDDGVDINHKDLTRDIVDAFDAIKKDSLQEPNPWDGHGTNCAGLAAAWPQGNGIRGVGAGCSIMPIRAAAATNAVVPWFMCSEQAADAIEWAWRHDAAVISLSWATLATANAVTEAIGRARKLGREGKGCVIIVAAGNESGAVNFPASLPDVMAVSATNEHDQFKTKTGPNEVDRSWGSNFGPEVAIAAPGVYNLTTDIVGEGGYSHSGYYARFSGTSSAAPLVAGAAALILSRFPSLTATQVICVLKSSAEKVAGDLPYVNGRNDQFGHGRLDVAKAIEKAAEMAQ